MYYQRVVEPAIISVEQIQGPVLLFAVQEDQIWPSVETIPVRGLSRQVDLEGQRRITDEVRLPNS